MNFFTLKKIQEEDKSFEKTLKYLREERGFDFNFLAKKIGIRKEYLEAIESGRSDLLPSGIYKKSYFKKYAEFIGVDKKIIERKIKELEEEERDDPFSKKIIKRKSLLVFPRIIKIIAFCLAVLFCFLYLIFYLRKTSLPPKLVVTSPENNLLTKERSVVVSGETENEAELRINGELILSNNNGNFYQEINLKSGLNNITISSKKKYSKENIIIKQILVE